ncbi:AraC family transcriptional regulator [Paraflavitalea speifideaquila]|uniref:helix-turn-helix domain-containing protein n=1 Tax=Paraflavitalea speifideaquila TaxID=3076558 RepID=UPI0028EA5267|nr:AraC family transcriptional regulator [Paraflavitalea speifideiaquila]
MLIRFTSTYIKDYRWKSIDHVECLLHHVTQLSDCIMKGETEKFLAKRIVDSLLHTINNHVEYDEDLTIHFVNALIVIAASNILKFKPTAIKPNADKKIHDIIAYIQVNITAPEKLKASVIGASFGISETYLSNYFKSQSGETIQHYIASYKLRMIEHRLKYSGMRINEIASEFGFTDESHLNKFFKKHHTISLREFRKVRTVIAGESTAS